MNPKRKRIAHIFIYSCLILGSIVVAVPFIWMIFSSFKSIEEFYVMPPKILPKQFSLVNFQELFSRANFGVYYKNSLIVTVSQVILHIILVTLAGYGFSKFQFKGKKVIFTLILSTTMVPWVATIIPLFIMAYKVDAIDSYFGLIFPGIADAFNIFLARNFISTIPNSLLESARIDGAGELTIFRRIILPSVKPILAVLTITKFIGSWNSFTWPVLVINSESLRTLPIGVAKFASQYYDNYNLRMASTFCAIIPVLIVYLVFQKYFVAGISLSGIKE